MKFYKKSFVPHFNEIAQYIILLLPISGLFSTELQLQQWLRLILFQPDQSTQLASHPGQKFIQKKKQYFKNINGYFW